MGSVMDQDRPWEDDEKPLETIRQRINNAAEFGQWSMIQAIVDELEELEEKIKSVDTALRQHIRGIRP